MRPFWKKPLVRLSHEEWEALCDGCGRCCLHKLEDEETGEIFYTSVACRLLDLASCRCSNYGQRHNLIPDCLLLGVDDPTPLQWLPRSCAYRLRSEGKPLPPWHPLLSGDPESARNAGVTACLFAISENDVSDPDEILAHIIDWPE